MQTTTLYALLALGAFVFWLRARDERRNFKGVPAVGSENWFLSWLTAFRLLNDATGLIQEGYDKYKGRAFKIPEQSRWRLMLTSLAQVEELRMAPDDTLSFDEATNDALQSEYTLGYEIAHNPYHIPLVRAQLTRNIIYLFPDIREELVAAFDDFIPAKNEWVKAPALDTIMNIVCRISNRVFVGAPLCRDPDYRELNIRFTIDVVLGGITLNLFPPWLRPTAGRLLTNVPTSIDRGVRHLEPIIRERFAMMEKYGDNWHEKPNDMLQWLMDNAEGKEREVRPLVLRILTINFAAIHTSSTSFVHALYCLAANPEYIQPMREEVDQVVAEDGWTKLSMQRMRKVDSFMKECQRLWGLGSISMSRLALKDYTFSDGTFVPKGSMISVAARAIHTDPEFYDDPEVFNPWRFADIREEEGEELKHQLVATAVDYVPFGHGRHACPGRFFAANELKCMMAHIVSMYDIRLEKPGGIPKQEWFSYAVSPNRKAEVLFRKRQS